MKITEKTFDALTGEETVTERDETVEEVAYRLKLEEKYAEELVEKQKAEAARQAVQIKLEALGLTTEDLKALGL